MKVNKIRSNNENIKHNIKFYRKSAINVLQSHTRVDLYARVDLPYCVLDSFGIKTSNT